MRTYTDIFHFSMNISINGLNISFAICLVMLFVEGLGHVTSHLRKLNMLLRYNKIIPSDVYISNCNPSMINWMLNLQGVSDKEMCLTGSL